MTHTQGGNRDGAQCESSASAAAGPRPTENLRGPDAFSARAAAAGAATADTTGGSAPLQQPSAPAGGAAPSAADEQLPGASGDDTASNWTVGSTERPNEGREKQHYWGQALQHLDREVCTPDGRQELSYFFCGTHLTRACGGAAHGPSPLACALLCCGCFRSVLLLSCHHICCCSELAIDFSLRQVEVQPGKKVTLLAKRDGGTIRFSLRVRSAAREQISMERG